HIIDPDWQIDAPFHPAGCFVANEPALRSGRALAPHHEHAFGTVELLLDRPPPLVAAADLRVPPDAEPLGLERRDERLHPFAVLCLVGDEHVAHELAPRPGRGP